MKMNTKNDLAEADLIIVGTGLSGAVIAERYREKYGPSKIIMFEQRDHVAGNIYDKKESGIYVQKMGSHIFHTNNDEVWSYVNCFTKFNNYQHIVLADTGLDVVTMPFNVQTMAQIFKTTNVKSIRERIEHEIVLYCKSAKIDRKNPQNFEEQAIVLVGTSMYEKLIQGYTEKQWGRDPKTLPAEIIKRLPIRWTTDSTYFNNAKHQGIPTEGYTQMVLNMINASGAKILWEKFDIEMLRHIPAYTKIIFTGELDALFNYKFGELEYRSLIFDEETIETDTYQGCPVVNYTNKYVPQTRITEHKFYMNPEDRPKDVTIISVEKAIPHVPGETIPYYPIGDKKNKLLYQTYAQHLDKMYGNQIIPVGRLATYAYLDMDKTIELALEAFKENFI